MSSDDSDCGYDGDYNDYYDPIGEYFYSYNFCPHDCSLLYKAVFDGDLNRVNSLLDEYSAEEENDGKTLLHVAAFKGHDQIIDLFCQHNFPVNKKDEYGATPLHLAIKQNHPKVFHLLLKKCNLNAKNFEEETPLHFALKEYHFQLAEILIKNNADVNVKDYRGETPLHFATRNKEVHIVKILLEKGAKVNVKNLYNETPAVIAAQLDHIQLLEIFLKNGAKADEQKNEDEVDSLLSYASENENMEMVKLLMMSEYYTLETKDESCKYALDSAARRNNFDLVKYLVENGFKVPKMSAFMSETQDQQLNLSEICDNSVNTLIWPFFWSDGPLHTSLSNQNLKIWHYLLKCSSKIDSKKYSKLHLAVQSGHVESVTEILKQQVNNVKTDSLASKLAVYIAVENGNETILKTLLEAGYSTESCYEDRTPLHIAATFNHTRLVKILLEAGTDVNSKTKYNYTPLDFAAAAGQSAVVMFLLDAGARIEDFQFSLKNVLRSGYDRTDHWIVTPFMFRNILKITEMVLIARNNENSFYRSYYNIFRYAMNIRVSRENEQNNCLSFKLKEETSNKEGAKESKDNTSVGEFRPEILRCFLSYLEYNDEVKWALYKVINSCTDPDPSVFDVILEHNYDTSLFKDYKSKLLLLGYVEDVDYLTNIPPYMLHDDLLKLTVARLVMLPNDLDSKEKKLKFYEKYNLVDWQHECEDQKESMGKTEIIDECNVSFYGILTQPIEKIANYIRSKDLLETLESSYMKFPAYATFLKMRIERGKRRRNLIDKCVNYMFHLIEMNYKIHFSIIDINNIFKYLSVNDLWNILLAFA